MMSRKNLPWRALRIPPAFFVVFLVGILAAAIAYVPSQGAFVTSGNSVAGGSDSQTVPWTAAQTVQPADLVNELKESNAAKRPVVVYVGFRPLYLGAHVPGAVFHGTAQTEQGLADLKKWAQSIPHSANLVIYCGCCPLDHCPNLRPAFTALREMGFNNMRVLVLPHDFATDWVEKGYAVEKGSGTKP
jgi:thiosulfate/3-mercaptopyruvate sulfurtransferase